MQKAKSIWSKSFIFIILTTTVYNFAHCIVHTAIPVYLIEIGVNKSSVGVITALFSVMSLVTRPFLGKILDRVNPKAVLLFGYGLSIICCFSYSLNVSVNLLIFFRCLYGAAFSISGTAIGTLVSQALSKEDTERGLGIYMNAMNVPSAFAPALGLFVASFIGYRYTFAIAAAIGIIYTLLCFLVPRMDYKNEEEPKEENAPNKNVSKSHDMPMIIYVFIMMLFMAGSFGGILTFLPSYMISLGEERTYFFFLTYAAGMLLSRPIANSLMRRHSGIFVLVPGVSSVLICMLFIFAAPVLWGFMLSGFFLGLGISTVFPLMNTFMLRAFPYENSGEATAIYLLTSDLGMIVGSISFGQIAERFGYSITFLTAAVEIFFDLVLTLIYLIRERRMAMR